MAAIDMGGREAEAPVPPYYDVSDDTGGGGGGRSKLGLGAVQMGEGGSC